MIIIKLRDFTKGSINWQFTVDQLPQPGIPMIHKGFEWTYRGMHHEVRESKCTNIVYANLDTIVEYVYKGKAK